MFDISDASRGTTGGPRALSRLDRLLIDKGICFGLRLIGFHGTTSRNVGMASGVCPLKAEIYRRCREAERSAMEHDFHWTKSPVALGSAVILLRANAPTRHA